MTNPPVTIEEIGGGGPDDDRDRAPVRGGMEQLTVDEGLMQAVCQIDAILAGDSRWTT